jgi:6-phosphogluconolactonase
VDERWVAETSERSNARLVHTHLLQGAAGAARFVSLVTNDTTPEAGLATVAARIAALPLPFAAVVLGMGEDGHTASFFPSGDKLGSALDPAGHCLVEAMRAPTAAEPRITLTLPILATADVIALHIEGEVKRRVFAQAENPGPVEDMPIRAILEAARQRVDVFWCP